VTNQDKAGVVGLQGMVVHMCKKSKQIAAQGYCMSHHLRNLADQ
jgi:hypothetical protein